MTSNPHTNRAARRAADLALIAATDHDPVCPVAGVARTLLVQQIGEEDAAQHIDAARGVLADQEG
ncbi:hypothetical protein FAF44_02755 [Nonomuraea sp. MG754425]|uniref:hypothetical protein n=1 Tax=Nonomuraea sp. MG754425 TaxID=2570319 RepID=UPI001F1DBF2A|nr:hypothetical protein [Nonomuraea sp. MG754425]MCF6467334.1 hypothetical protein [Nonomuraea sp. MG754425]